MSAAGHEGPPAGRGAGRVRRVVLVLLAFVVVGVGPALDQLVTGARAFGDLRHLERGPQAAEPSHAVRRECCPRAARPTLVDNVAARLGGFLRGQEQEEPQQPWCDGCGTRLAYSGR